MTNTVKLAELNKIEKEQRVMCSYSGRPGCMCGCNGKYSYTTKLRDFSGEDRGYSIDDDEISDVAVKRMINKFKKLLQTDVKIDLNMSSGYFFYETPSRYNAIYFK